MAHTAKFTPEHKYSNDSDEQAAYRDFVEAADQVVRNLVVNEKLQSVHKDFQLCAIVENVNLIGYVYHKGELRAFTANYVAPRTLNTSGKLENMFLLDEIEGLGHDELWNMTQACYDWVHSGIQIEVPKTEIYSVYLEDHEPQEERMIPLTDWMVGISHAGEDEFYTLSDDEEQHLIKYTIDEDGKVDYCDMTEIANPKGQLEVLHSRLKVLQSTMRDLEG